MIGLLRTPGSNYGKKSHISLARFYQTIMNLTNPPEVLFLQLNDESGQKQDLLIVEASNVLLEPIESLTR
jgi:hypothetical protein